MLALSTVALTLPALRASLLSQREREEPASSAKGEGD